MALVNYCGWETGDLLEALATGANASAPSTTVSKTGTYSFKFDTVANGDKQWCSFGGYGATGVQAAISVASAGYFKFNLYVSSVHTNQRRITLWGIDNSGTTQSLNLNPLDDGAMNLGMFQGSGGIGGWAARFACANGTTVITVDTWHLIEILYDQAASPKCKVWVDGVLDISTSVNIDGSFVRSWIGAADNTFSAGAPQATTCYVDNYVWSTTAIASTSVILPLVPDGDSATNTGYTASAGSKWQCVDDIPQNGDTDYISTVTANEVYTATLKSAASSNISGTINAVKPTLAAKFDTGNTAHFFVEIRSGSTNSANASEATPTAAYLGYARILETDPTDAGTWTTGKLDALEVGAMTGSGAITGGHSTRVSQALVMVLHQPSTVTIPGITASLLRSGNGAGKPNPNPIGPPTRARTKPRFVKATRRR